jgi:hypothetical protein
MTERHNRVANFVREAVIKYIGTELQSEIRENTSIPEDQLTEQLRSPRPDMVFEGKSRKRGRRSEGEEVIEEEDPKILEMIEFSCPYGHKSHGRDILKVTYQQKNEKKRIFGTWEMKKNQRSKIEFLLTTLCI